MIAELGLKPLRYPARFQHGRGQPDPLGSFYVGRPSRYGNPWRIGELGEDGEPMTRADVLDRYRAWATDQLSMNPRWLQRLRYRRYLTCWCAIDLPCHADILRELLAATYP